VPEEVHAAHALAVLDHRLEQAHLVALDAIAVGPRRGRKRVLGPPGARIGGEEAPLAGIQGRGEHAGPDLHYRQVLLRRALVVEGKRRRGGASEDFRLGQQVGAELPLVGAQVVDRECEAREPHREDGDREHQRRDLESQRALDEPGKA
jgi:hypothetical protein